MKIENASVASTGKIIDETENPTVRLVMEIIQRDSQVHYRVQELIADSLESKALTLSPDEIGKVWGSIEKHIELEKKTVEMANASIKAIGKNRRMVVQRYLLEYLLGDEEKHNVILENLEQNKKDRYPYG
jgi:hypothetical protein